MYICVYMQYIRHWDTYTGIWTNYIIICFFLVNIVMSIVHSYSPMDKGRPQLDRSHCSDMSLKPIDHVIRLI